MISWRTIKDEEYGYSHLMQGIIQQKNIPLAVYSDRYLVFRPPKRKEDTAAISPGDTDKLIQFGRAMRELGITQVFAHSPEAKGRIERANGTFQDRLVSELRLAGANTLGEANKAPRLFTTASVRGILHNPFYSGKVIHQGKLLPGAHEALVSPDLFDIVQSTLKKNRGRSETLQAKPEREYLLKGIVRCIFCGMPMWAQTYKNGNRYYREHQKSRSIKECPTRGGLSLVKSPMKKWKLIEAIELKPKWQEEVLSIISLKDEVERVKRQRLAIQEKLRRMAKAMLQASSRMKNFTGRKDFLKWNWILLSSLRQTQQKRLVT